MSEFPALVLASGLMKHQDKSFKTGFRLNFQHISQNYIFFTGKYEILEKFFGLISSEIGLISSRFSFENMGIYPL